MVIPAKPVPDPDRGAGIHVPGPGDTVEVEAVAYELAGRPSPALLRMAGRAIDVSEAVQREDGRINSYTQVFDPDGRLGDPAAGDGYLAGKVCLFHLPEPRVKGVP